MLTAYGPDSGIKFDLDILDFADMAKCCGVNAACSPGTITREDADRLVVARLGEFGMTDDAEPREMVRIKIPAGEFGMAVADTNWERP